MRNKQRESFKELVAVIDMVHGAITAAGKAGAPRGMLAGLMSRDCSLSEYNSIIDALIKTGKIREVNHVIYSVTPSASIAP